MDPTMVTSALRIGAALGSAADVEWDEVFDAITGAVPDVCAAQVVGWDPVVSRFVVLAERGYSRSISHDLAHELPRTRWGGQLFDSDVPLLMDDAPHNFRDSPHYQENLRPAGLEDGLSAALRLDRHRVVGMLHINASVQQAFGERTRAFVGELERTVARRVDPLRSPRFEAWFGPEWTASRLVPGGTPLPLADRAASPLADDPKIQAIGAAFADLGVGTVAFLWPGPDGWYRVRLLRIPDGVRTGVILASAPYANNIGLTAREVDVATGIVAGLSNQAIAESLVVSRRTVETYVERLLGKLDCQSRGEAAGVAARAGIIRPTATPGGVGDLHRLTRGADPHWP
ncbi:DNA-binding CsgD family transcriptional regulator [Actinokineospora baliensis]|uniref:helix-turn-helix transcriptional regulator n=1 Tax=Actinokineospora baliensis TaxID=547056 RepID=UPI001959E745|nr:helix-turn-helix transcriptional regulator [Actinokineospora baliensis]MBM7773378.1 DNA-binding CsgD family transcriptional regulator [Actinokineospora baliensis]